MLALAACSSDPGDSDLPSEVGPRPLGALEIITAHTRSAIDPDGYTLMLNGVAFGAMDVADTLLLRSLPEAEYSVGLADVAAYCDNGGGNPRGVAVSGNRTSRVIFHVKCRGPGPP